MDFVIRLSVSTQLIGDYFLLMGEIILLLNIQRKRNCTGISLKTQIILAIVFTLRYMDLAISYSNTYGDFTNSSVIPVIVYNAIKVAHLFVIYWTILIVLLYFNEHEDRKFDTFRIEILTTACVILTLLLNYDFHVARILKTFSYSLEAIATLPQTYLVSKARYLDKVLIYYIGFLTLYKLSYTISWIYSLVYLSHRFESIALFGGIIQLIIYLNFFVSNIFVCNYRSNCLSDLNQQDESSIRIKIVQSKNQFGHCSKINTSSV